MKKLVLIIVCVAVLAGCAARSPKGTAEIVMRDGQKWVHVLGTGVEFPLLGEWRKARISSKNSKFGIITVATLFENDKSGSKFEVGSTQGFKRPLPDVIKARWENIDDFGNNFCKDNEFDFVTQFTVENTGIFVQCKNKEIGFSFLFIDKINDDSANTIYCIAYVGFGVADKNFGPTFIEMMRRIVVH